MKTYPSEEWCLNLLRQLRWPIHIYCPLCNQKAHIHFHRGLYRWYQCGSCNRVFSDTTATPFKNSKLPLSYWFVALALIQLGEEHRLNDFQKQVGISRPTILRMKDRIHEAASDPLLRMLSAGVLSWQFHEK
jgi:transposase-like protein